MKIFISLFVSLLSLTFVKAQGVCSTYYAMGQGTNFQLTQFDGKNNEKVLAVTNYKVIESTTTLDGQKATILTEIVDKKGEVTATSEYEIICENDVVSIDFKSLMGPDVFAQFPEMDMEVSGTALELPNSLSAGQSLPDADLLAVVNMTPIKMRLTFIMTNRKVAGEETITTPAGTFDCIVLTYDYESKFGVKVTGTAKQYLAKGIGVVLQIDYNKKGKEVSRTVLTAFAV